jgi:RNA polymerase sigma-70 factor, ECF subfamily
MGPTAAAAATPAASRDREVVEALRAGDEQAFLGLVRTLGPAMLRVALGYVGSRAVAEEVVQEAWLGVLDGIKGFEGRAPLKSWIFSILANCARTRGTREARSVPLSALAHDEDGPTVDASRFLDSQHSRWTDHWAQRPARWTDQQLEDHRSARAARAAIEVLPPQQREVITLRDVEGLSSEEVCAALGLSEGNQRVLLHRARAKVRAALEAFMAGGEAR